MKTFFLTSNGLNQRCYVWLLKAMMSVKAHTTTGVSLWMAVMAYIARTNMHVSHPETEHLKLWMGDALVRQYSLVKRHLGLAGFVTTHRKQLSLMMDVHKLENALSVKVGDENSIPESDIITIMQTNIGSELLGFMHVRCLFAAFKLWLENWLKKVQDKKLTATHVAELAKDSVAKCEQLGYEDCQTRTS